MLVEAEGLRPHHMPAYNAVLYGWGVPAGIALVRDTPPGVRRWGLLGALAAAGFRPSARYHFRWVGEQAHANPAWWNRALARASDPGSAGRPGIDTLSPD
jgi:hypothetical protein